MGWLDALERRAREAVGSVPVAAPAREPAKPQPKPEIKTVWVQIAPASPPDYPGAVEPAFYFVTDSGVLSMCDDKASQPGKPMCWARTMTRTESLVGLFLAAWSLKANNTNFNRPMRLQRWGVA